MDAILTNLAAAAGPLGVVFITLAVTCLVDTGSGIWAAVKSGTFDLSFADTFVKSHIFDKWGPIVGTLLGGIAIGGTDNTLGSLIVAAGVAQVTAYELATVSSVFGIGSPQDGNIKAARAKTKGLPSSVAPPPSN